MGSVSRLAEGVASWGLTLLVCPGGLCLGASRLLWHVWLLPVCSPGQASIGTPAAPPPLCRLHFISVDPSAFESPEKLGPCALAPGLPPAPAFSISHLPARAAHPLGLSLFFYLGFLPASLPKCRMSPFNRLLDSGVSFARSKLCLLPR